MDASTQKSSLKREKIFLIVQKFKLRPLQRLDAIQTEPPFLPLDQNYQEEDQLAASSIRQEQQQQKEISVQRQMPND